MRRDGARRIWSVTDVTAAVARRLAGVPQVWIEGEVQDLRTRGGQVFFALADGHRIDASMNAATFARLAAPPRPGQRVVALGTVVYWRPRSQVTFRAEALEPVGEGALRARVDALRAAIAAEGLLDPERKRRPPLMPRRIGLVTSAGGAARRDFERGLWSRYPADLLLVDVPVQGEAAPAAVVRAIRWLDARAEIEVIAVVRGGGALEDLMAFNDERVVRAIAACTTPVVVGVGHEVDHTLADLVADVRASTPTAAAAAVVPDRVELVRALDAAERALPRRLRRVAGTGRERLAQRAGRLRTHLDGCQRAAGGAVTERGRRLARSARRARAAADRDLTELERGLDAAARRRLAAEGARLARAGDLIDALSPRATVARGYAIVRAPDGRPITRRAGLVAGDPIGIEFRDGRIRAQVVADG